MKQPPAQTLSDHLLREAEKFRMYPERIYRTRKNLNAQKSFDKFMGRIVEWRKTFVPSGKAEDVFFSSDRVLLDEFYCRDLLKAIPGIVERTAKLSHLTLSGIPKSEFVYLREAATCYLLGLPAAAVALARAAIEHSLRRELAKFYGKAAVADEDLKNLLDELSPRGKTLSREGRDLAHKVRVAANIVLHGEPGVEPDALVVLEAAKTVILELSRR
jgi:hypothetical protein